MSAMRSKAATKSFPKAEQLVKHWNSKMILDLLAARHIDSLFVPECKDGPTQGTEHFRMDAWAMRKSWANPCFTAYEIKVSRSDFVRDDKWRVYLGYCNELYFVCPPGLISPDELPPEVGLLYASSTGSRLFIKKRAVFRKADIPETLWMYVLMCRVRVMKCSYESELPDKRAIWREWLSRKIEDRELGNLVSKGIRETVEKQIDLVKSENQRLVSRMEGYDAIIAMLREMGVTTKTPDTWHVKNRIQEIEAILPQEIENRIHHARDDLSRLIDVIDKAKHPEKTPLESEDEL